MDLTIISPEKVLFTGKVTSVQVPGKAGRFEVLANHAPIISSLDKGTILYKDDDEHTQEIKRGFVEVANNKVTICVEL